MTEYRHRETGEIKTQGQWRAVHLGTSFPKVWTKQTLDFLNVDPVLPEAQPTPGKFEKVEKNGAIQDENGNWVENWVVVDMFTDTIEEDGSIVTKAEHEAAYQFELDAEAAKNIREQRNFLLAETDWMALSDVTMTEEMTAYRQALRDISSHENFPYLEVADWPTKPV